MAIIWGTILVSFPTAQPNTQHPQFKEERFNLLTLLAHGQWAPGQKQYDGRVW